MGYYVVARTPFMSVPEGIQTVTIKYRLRSLPDLPQNYTLVTGSAQVQPQGVLVSPVTINNLIDGEWYTLWVTNNCGGTGIKKDFQAALATTEAPNTTVPQTTAPATTTVPATTTEEGQTTGPVTTTVAPATTTQGITTTQAPQQRHLDALAGNYVFHPGPITGFCTITDAYMDRNSDAVFDATAASDRVQVTVRLTAYKNFNDQIGGRDINLIFEPNATRVNVSTSLPDDICDTITFQVLNIQVIG